MHGIIYFIVNFALVIRVLGDSESGPTFRIFNGNNANILNYPYLVSVQLGRKHNCGGSLIRANLVLTAAHCIVFEGNEVPPEYLLVRAGTTFKGQDGQTAAVIECCVHRKYKILVDGRPINDEAVIKLNHSLTLNLCTQLIKLQPKGLDVPDNSIGTLVGWGAIRGTLDSLEYPLILQEIKLFKINQEVCQVLSFLPIFDSTTCFGSGIGSKSFCKGDSGGPLVVDGRQVGIVSYFAVGCGLPLFFPNVYMRVEHEDIRSHIDQCISQLEK